jgi:hypothetical protein
VEWISSDPMAASRASLTAASSGGSRPILLKNSAVGSSVESVGESCRAD